MKSTQAIRRMLVIVCLLASLDFSGLSAATTISGTACQREGLTRKVGGYEFICGKGTKGKLRWRQQPKTTTKTTTTATLPCAVGGVCAVGNIGPGGGIVVYVHPGGGTFASPGSDCGTSCMYLEAAPTNQTDADDLLGVAWCDNTENLVGGRETAIGSGMGNTMKAAGACRSGAIRIAVDYANNGKTDWHLPSKDELSEIYEQQNKIYLFCCGYFWSSSQSSDTHVWAAASATGYQIRFLAEQTKLVRLVRAFAATTTTPRSTTTTTAQLPCAVGGVCAVGNIGPGGGIVVYVHPGGGTFASPGSDCGTRCRYLEAAPIDWNDYSTMWDRWCNVHDKEVGGRETAIGSGMGNTMKAAGACRSGAIRIAVDYANNGKTDWHLPSKDELNEVYKQRRYFGYSVDEVWNSSEISLNLAGYKSFRFPYQEIGGKIATYRVLPVRAF